MSEQKAGVLDAETGDKEQKNQGNANNRQEQKKNPNAAEIITFIVSLLIVLAVVGTIIFLMLTESGKPASISVTPEIGSVRQQDGMYYVPVKVENKGGLGVEAVLIRVTLDSGSGEKTEAEFTVDFLAGGAGADGVVVFREKPTSDNLTAECVSYMKP